MVYTVIGTMSGSSMDGLDIAYCTLEEIGGQWNVIINAATCIEFDETWKHTLQTITQISAKEMMLAHTAFGSWMGQKINTFIDEHGLQHKVHLIASHGHTVFHEPALGMSFQLGDGASIAAITNLPVVSDLRSMDVALGGQGAPIVPIAEKLLWNDYQYFLNLGGICNITSLQHEQHIAFDVCPANRVLNLLVHELGMAYDANGLEASKGTPNDDLLYDLNALDYYKQAFPKSLSNEFGIDQVFQLIQTYTISIQDKLATYCKHIAQQIKQAIVAIHSITTTLDSSNEMISQKMLVTGGGAFNGFLIASIASELQDEQIELSIPDENLVQYKEAIAMALIGVLRWREEENVVSSVTGARRSSVGGALWMGQE